LNTFRINPLKKRRQQDEWPALSCISGCHLWTRLERPFHTIAIACWSLANSSAFNVIVTEKYTQLSLQIAVNSHMEPSAGGGGKC